MKYIFMTVSVLFLSPCAFIPHHDKRPYPFAAKEAKPRGTSVKLLVSTEKDNLIGHIRNNAGSETADITIPDSRSAVIRTAIERSLKSDGFTLDANARNAVLVRINQFEIELAQERGGVGYFAVCDLTAYLKTEKGLFERQIVGTDEVFSALAVGGEQGVDAGYGAAHKCADALSTKITEKFQ